jgi:hypothetical protein
MSDNPQGATSGGRKSPAKAFPKNTKFACPKCSAWVLVHVPLKFRPACTRHAGGATQMEETK